MPSSLVKDKGEGEGEGEQIVVDDSDIEILEEMNGTPDRVAAGKRRHESEFFNYKAVAPPFTCLWLLGRGRIPSPRRRTKEKKRRVQKLF